MRRKTRVKVKKWFKILAIILGIIFIILGILFAIKLNKNVEMSYEDGIVCKNYFCKITIDINSKKVQRDNKETTMKEEFGISEEQQNIAFSSIDEIKNLLSNSVFDISVNEDIITITNKYQTKKLIVQSSDVKEKVEGESIVKLQDDLYMLSFESEKLTKAMYSYYSKKDYIQEIYVDEIFMDEPTKEISQTMYGEKNVNLLGYKSLGVNAMGIDNYKQIINNNGNPQEIVVATIGYGLDTSNNIFTNRISNKSYNFILNNTDIEQTISQGSRVGEILVDSCTDNVFIMPLVVVSEEGYTSVGAIVSAICYGVKNSDVICYELINCENGAIDLALKNAFKENVPVTCVSSNTNENYPAKHGMTIAVSSIDRDFKLSDYSGKGPFIDFTAPSTDVEEIFNNSSTVSRWSGPQYSNAHIAAIIALIKTYSKNATILDIYNFLRNYSLDIGKIGKDEEYGYGCPIFKNLTISDIDKEAPIISGVTFDNEIWEVIKKINIVAKDNIRIYRWAVTQNDNVPLESEWNNVQELTPNIDVSFEITKNGIYYIFIQDSAGNMSSQKIEINKVDNTPPKIAYSIDKKNLSQGSVIINVTAEDTESGLYDSPFSWDEITWSIENDKKIVTSNGRYKIYAVDNLGNKAEQEIVVDCFPQEGTYELGEEGFIIENMSVSSDWTDNTNNNVKINLKSGYNIVAWQITSDTYVPTTFVELNLMKNNELNDPQQQEQEQNTINSINSNNTNTINTTTQNIAQQQQIISNEPITITTQLDANIVYYLWVKDYNGTLTYQSFKISKALI